MIDRPPRSIPRWLTIAVAVLVIAHFGFGVARIPGKVYGKRFEEIARYRELGAARYFLATEHLHGADAVERVRRSTPEDCAVLWSGEWKGAMEFVSPILFPRLLVPAEPARDDAADGRTLARLADEDGRLRLVVLVGRGDRVELELR